MPGFNHARVQSRAACCRTAQSHHGRDAMAKGQQRSNKEARKPKKPKVKTIAANPSQKGGGGLSKG